MVLKKALNHSDVVTSQRYLDTDEDAVFDAIRRTDFTRSPRKTPALQIAALPEPIAPPPASSEAA